MNPMKLNSDAAQEKLPLNYFLLVFVLALPLWIFGGSKLPLPINLPVSALATFIPMIAALILSYRKDGSRGIRELLKKILDSKKIKNKVWYLPALILMPLIHLLAYIIMRLVGMPLPDTVKIPLLSAPGFFLLFFIGDTGEELGWTGYALDPMLDRWRALKAGLILGVVWVIWHTIPWVQTGNSTTWIIWQALYSIAQRILMVWIYNNTGKSVFAVILFHVTVNMSWALFPNLSSHYDPFIVAVITWITVAIVVLRWGAKTLTREHQVLAGNMPAG